MPLTDAVALLELVAASDPGFAPGWALLAQAYSLLPGMSPETRRGSVEESRRFAQAALDKGEKAAQEAIRLDSKNAVGYAALARIQALHSNRVAAEDLFKQALALDPSDPEVLANYIIQLAVSGRLKEAVSLSEKLRALEPFVPGYGLLTISVMQANGQSRATIPILEAMPTGEVRNARLAYAYAAEGRFRQAADTLLAITGDDQVERRSVEDAARLLRNAPTKVAPEALPALGDVDFVYAYVGALDRVLEPWERNRQIQIGVPTSIWLPLYAPLRKTERFKVVLRGAGLVDYWRAKGWPEFCHPVGADDFVCE
jgi:predicted Zn-dependent protease